MIPRRIQFTGRSTYVVSLPKSWVKENKLDSNRLVYIYRIGDNGLLIIPYRKRDRANKICEMRVANGDDVGKVVRKIIAYYIRGYDVITIRSIEEYLSPNLKNALKNRVKRLIFGSEFLDETAQYLSIHIIASSVDLDINTVIKRMSSLAINMHRDTIKAINLRNGEILKEILNRDDDMDRLYFLSVRMLNQYTDLSNINIYGEKLRTIWELMEYRAVVRYLERVADHATIIATSMNNVLNKYTDQDAKTLTALNGMSVAALRKAIEALLNRDVDMAEEAISYKNKIREIEERAVSRLAMYTDPQLISSLRMSIESCRRVFEYGAGIAEIAINLGLR